MPELFAADGVRVSREDDLVRVELISPDTRNAQTPATWRRLASVPRYLDDLKDNVRAVVLSAEGPSFSAGLDRRMMSRDGIPGEETLATVADSESATEAFIVAAQSAFTWWRAVPQVTIALVHGHAIGAGFQLALAADVMVVADDAQLAMRETSLGLVPDLAGTRTLVELVGYSRAFEMCVRGRYVDAAEAVRLGIATAQVPRSEWDAYLKEFLAPIRAALPGAVAELKGLLDGAGSHPDQLGRERTAQAARIRELRALLGA